ncbi:hypothetical protein [Nocardioides daejeonensis]|uniref:hypothetical protein n=1 Tax=Nocardioides daejeonensis TaxID=1046556 RepID=UPI000D74F5A9|nr:hypothetical protein [Nocardioides daejeonensis]
MSIIAKPRDERGAVALFVAILLVVLVGLASFAVDLGYQRVAARDMQAVADVVAMDMARQLDGKTTEQLNDTPAWTTALAGSLERNDDRAVGEKLSPVSCSAGQASIGAGEICATPGIYNSADRTFVDSGSSPATHVRVITRTSIDYFFPIFADNGEVMKTAYAEGGDGACIRISSYVADANLNDGALGPLLDLLGTKVGLGALDAGSLVATDVSLLKLLSAKVGAGSLDSVLNSQIGLGSFYLAMADALQGQDGSAAAISVLEALSGRVGDMKVKVSDLLALDTTGVAGADAMLNVFDMVATGLVAASGENGLALTPTINLPGGLLNLSGTVSVLQRPQVSCGKRKNPNNPLAETAQVKVNLGGSAPVSESIIGQLLNTVLGVLGDVLTGLLGLEQVEPRVVASVDVNLGLQVVPARARLTGVECVGDKRKVYVKVAGGQLLEISLTVNAKVGIEERRRKRATILSPWRDNWGPWTPVLTVGGPVTVSNTGSGPAWTDHVITIDKDGDYDVPQFFPKDSIGLPTLPSIDASQFNVTLPPGVPTDYRTLPLGNMLGMVVAPVLNGLNNSLVSSLNTQLNTVLINLGIDVAGARISALRTPSCGTPALRG